MDEIKTRPLRRFAGNNLMSELYKSAASAAGLEGLPALRDRICAALPVSQVMLGRWLNNTSQPSLGEAAEIAQLLGIPVDTLCRFAAE